MTAEPPADAVALPVLWRGLDDHPILFANQFVVQNHGDGLLLTIGQFQPPILLGEPEERLEQAKRLGYLPVNAVARLAFTRSQLGLLADLLREHLQKYDKAEKGQDDADSDV